MSSSALLGLVLAGCTALATGHGSVSSITFSYRPSLNTSGNRQGCPGGYWSLTSYNTPQGYTLPTTATVTSSDDDSTVHSVTAGGGGSFTVGSDNDRGLSATTVYSLRSTAGTLIAAVSIHTSCSVPIYTGDAFGFLVIESMVAADDDADGTDGCGESNADKAVACGETVSTSGGDADAESRHGGPPPGHGGRHGGHAHVATMGLRYTGSAMTCGNLQGASGGGKWEVTLQGSLPHEAGIGSITSSFSSAVHSLASGDEFSVSSSDGELPASSTFTLLDGSGAMVATVVVHTSCSYPIHVGDIFGFLEITAMTMTSTSSDGGATAGCGGTSGTSSGTCPTPSPSAPAPIPSPPTTGGADDTGSIDDRAGTIPVATTTVAVVDRLGSTASPTPPPTTLPPTPPPTTLPPTPPPTFPPTPPPTTLPPTPPPTLPPAPPPTTVDVGPVGQTWGSTHFATTVFASTANGNGGVGDDFEAASCRVHLHETGAIAGGACSATEHLDEVFLGASIGFSTQVCTERAPAFTPDTTLRLTIQPVCRIDVEPQRWTICSWRPDPSSMLCNALGLACCDFVGESIGDQTVNGEAVRDLDLSCQEYVEGDCMPFFGIDAGGAVTQYALELIECIGDAPPNPQCRSALSATGTSWSSTAKLEGGAAMVGLGMILVAAAMSYRRHRRQTAVLYDSLRASTPDEITPLVDAAGAGAGRGTSTSDCLLPGITDHIDHVGRMAARSPQSPMDYAYADGRPDLTESPPIIV